MIQMDNLLNMQAMMLLLALAGILFNKKKIITPEGRRCLTDISINLLIPCSTLTAFFNAEHEMLGQMTQIMLVSLVIQIGVYLLSKVLFRKMPGPKRSVMRYGTMVSNAGVLGNPMVEGLYGQAGMLLASVFLVPVRLFLWTVGLACFAPVDKKQVVRTALTHPCITSVFLGIAYLLFPIPLPVFLTKTIAACGSAMTPVTMLLIGAILADVDLRTVISRDTLYISFIRLIAIPLVVFLGVMATGLPPLPASVSVILVSMPVATTSVILAARYDGDYEFATKVVVLTTVLSLVTVPVWSLLLGYL